MKISQLKEVIRAKVRKAKELKEMNALVTTRTGTKPVTYNNASELGNLRSDANVSSIVSTNGQKIKENEDFTMDRIWKMNRNELIKFLGLNPGEAKNWGDRELQGAALELADDKPKDSEPDNSSVMESGTGDQPISSMSRADLLKHFKLDPNTPEEELSTEYLKDAMSGLDEADYIDDDDTVHEGVDDEFTDFKDYDQVYEDMENDSSDVSQYELSEIDMMNDFRANVGSGHRGLSVKLHPMDQRLLMISQDNGQRVVVEVEDIPELLNVLRGLM